MRLKHLITEGADAAPAEIPRGTSFALRDAEFQSGDFLPAISSPGPIAASPSPKTTRRRTASRPPTGTAIQRR